MLTRRQFLAAGAATGAGLLIPWQLRLERLLAAVPGGTLDPESIAKYQLPLVIPPAMPRTARIRGEIDAYHIGVRQFAQQILPPNLPKTTVWGYGSLTHPGTFNYPSFTIEADVDRPVRVKWVNELMDARHRYLPHLLAVDPTLHWANPAGGEDGRDMRPVFTSTPGPYRGPVPFVTHLHGGHTREESDGYPEAWYLPHAANIPAGYARVGSFYQEFREKAEARFGASWTPGSAVYQYENDQRAGTNWFHDHTLGMTRLNVYAGPAGFWLLRGGRSDLPAGVLPGPAPRLGDAPGTRYFEIPIVVQDRSFNRDGSLAFPTTRGTFGDVDDQGPFIPDSDVSPIWNPEFFGNTMVVNGRTWPVLEVEPRRYRFRLLNGCNSRFVMLKIAASPEGARPATAALPFWQIGSEGGFLPSPVQRDRLLVANAERADVIVDFTGLGAGTELYLINEGPDEPYGGGEPGTDFEAADPATTGQVMKFVVGRLSSVDGSVPPSQLSLPTFTAIGASKLTRQVSLNEAESSVFEGAPSEALLGTVNADGTGNPMHWMDEITEHVNLGDVETWEISNLTADAHPIHIHEVMFQVVDRQPIGGAARPPEPTEHGLKDTVVTLPGEITRLKARFDLPGRYVWHCHIVDHEDNEMMRPFRIGP
jgi:spore coat protein A, manganese oxidase